MDNQAHKTTQEVVWFCVPARDRPAYTTKTRSNTQKETHTIFV